LAPKITGYIWGTLQICFLKTACRIAYQVIANQVFAYWVIAYRVIACRVIAISGYCHIGFLFKIARIFVISGYCISGYCNIGLLSYRVFIFVASPLMICNLGNTRVENSLPPSQLYGNNTLSFVCIAVHFLFVPGLIIFSLYQPRRARAGYIIFCLYRGGVHIFSLYWHGRYISLFVPARRSSALFASLLVMKHVYSF
jgi:hypothetical protein